MSDVSIPNDVSKITLGDQVLYDRDVQNSAWLECPDNGVEGQDFKGLTLMKWDRETNTARFKSSANVEAPKYTTTNLKNRLAITLPDGYKFLENSSKLLFYGHYSSVGIKRNEFPVSIDGNQLSVQVANNGPDMVTYYVCEVDQDNNAMFDAELVLNVAKTI